MLGAPSTTTIVLLGMASLLAVFAIIMKVRARKPKRPEKWEKAQIMKRLIALSESEGMPKGISSQQPASQSPTPRRRAAAASSSSSRTVRPA